MNARHRLARAILAAALLGAVACNRADDRPAEWAYISPAIFQPNCATTSCHSPAAAVSGLDFSTPANGYASLTEQYVWVVFPPDGGFVRPLTPPDAAFFADAGQCGVEQGVPGCYEPRPLVTPYDPAGSRVVNCLRARDAPRMPPDRPLPEADIELVERWILNGATEYPIGQAPGDASVIKIDGSTPHADGSSDARGPEDAAGPRDARGDGSGD